MSNGLQWSPDGRSEISTWGTYGLRVKRLSKGRWWWCVSGMLKGKRQVKVVDGLARCRKEAVNAVVAGLCGVAEEYRALVVASREAPWYKRSKGWKPMVGRVRV